ncbi:aldehyde dehydrogenase family protein [Streptomyces sp. NPDC054987]
MGPPARVGRLLREPFRVLGLKARLERGEELAYDEGLMAGRVVMSTPEQGLRALAAARAAQPAWSRVPLDDRLELLDGVYRAVVDRRAELVDLPVAEGHPVRPATWEVASAACAFHPDSVADFTEQLGRPARASAGRRGPRRAGAGLGGPARASARVAAVSWATCGESIPGRLQPAAGVAAAPAGGADGGSRPPCRLLRLLPGTQWDGRLPW